MLTQVISLLSNIILTDNNRHSILIIIIGIIVICLKLLTKYIQKIKINKKSKELIKQNNKYINQMISEYIDEVKYIASRYEIDKNNILKYEYIKEEINKDYYANIEEFLRSNESIYKDKRDIEMKINKLMIYIQKYGNNIKAIKNISLDKILQKILDDYSEFFNKRQELENKIKIKNKRMEYENTLIEIVRQNSEQKNIKYMGDITINIDEKYLDLGYIILSNSKLYSIHIKYKQGIDDGETLMIDNYGHTTLEKIDGSKVHIDNPIHEVSYINKVKFNINKELHAKYGSKAPYIHIEPIIIFANNIKIHNKSKFCVLSVREIDNILRYINHGMKIQPHYYDDIERILRNISTQPRYEENCMVSMKENYEVLQCYRNFVYAIDAISENMIDFIKGTQYEKKSNIKYKL
ncbi:hypothetical protein [Alkalithermobacter paradoxus]|uniref:Uncharacterized protein n=1 Tax=Alkalithermobacter paradoxus TaxID=29349 RepID=A0A1V4IB51_9FIRM|nr:hypothetical protein CLOTH_05050 [[Clostridium] thermoalcaliphilum]